MKPIPLQGDTMKMCHYLPIAHIVCERTKEMITALNGGVAPKITEDTVTQYFMIYCAGSDHEEREFITTETYDQTYESMPNGVLVMYVDLND
jgi:hypothetical protein